MSTVYYAKWLLLPSGDMVRNGAVAVSGNTITSVGPRSRVRRARHDRVVNLGEMLMLPGLINMHMHLEEGVARGARDAAEETFSSWTAKKNSRLRQTSMESVLPAVRLGIRQSLANGVTTIVDSSRTGASLVVLKDEPVRAWVIQEVNREEDAGEERALRLLEQRKRVAAGVETLEVGLGPHALFSISPGAHRRIIDLVRTQKCVWTSHMAESAEELQAFSEQTGDLYFQITRRRAWEYGRSVMGPMHYAITSNLIPNGAILFHCNYVNGHELALLSAKNVSIVVSLRYSEAQGHKALPLDVALSRKITLCVGTESISDSGSANLFDELYTLRQAYPHIPARELIRWVTQNPARALRMTGRLGVLSPGAFADIVGVSFAHDPREDVLEELLVEEPSVRFVMVNGEEVIVDY